MPLTQPTHAHRHTIATRLSEDGTETLRLKHFMGHSSLQTTERYVHANVESKKVILKGILMKKGVAHG
jgi:integrase